MRPSLRLACQISSLRAARLGHLRMLSPENVSERSANAPSRMPCRQAAFWSSTNTRSGTSPEASMVANFW